MGARGSPSWCNCADAAAAIYLGTNDGCVSPPEGRPPPNDLANTSRYQLAAKRAHGKHEPDQSWTGGLELLQVRDLQRTRPGT